MSLELEMAEALHKSLILMNMKFEEVLENWLELLQQKRIASETHYSLYHSNF
ncbi:hypothetical protein [Nostoc sp.]|uniref:hypothetical protein n=1 Tax=Nostoc sp. TaxID=1180 RepID=UPI002FF5D9D2